jgi:hypothetical protein
MIFGTLQTNNLSQTSSQPHFVVFNKSLKMRCTNIVLDHWPWIVERLGKFSAPDQRLITKEVTHPSSGGGGGAHSSNHCWVKNRRISVRCSPCNELGNIVSRHQHLHCIHLFHFLGFLRVCSLRSDTFWNGCCWVLQNII